MAFSTRFLAACAGAALCAGAGAATKCVTGGWPVADVSVRAGTAAALASGGAGASTGAALETRFRTSADAADFALDTRPASGFYIIVR